MPIDRISFQSAKMNRRTDRTRISTQSKKPAAKKMETKVDMPARMTIATTHKVSNLPQIKVCVRCQKSKFASFI